MRIEVQDKFLRYLSQNNRWIHAKELAKEFNVTPRTIRNYVSFINNKRAPHVVIESSDNGYRINMNTLKIQKTAASDTFFDTPTGRINYILYTLLTKGNIRFEQVMEKYYVSDSTVENDLNTIRKIIKPFNLNLKRVGQIISIIGIELDKRKLMRHLIYNESDGTFIHSEFIQTYFPEYDVSHIKQKVQALLDQHGFSVNGFTINGIILHLLVILQRVTNNYEMNGSLPPVEVTETEDYQKTFKIATEIEKLFKVSLNPSEKYYLTLLLISKTETINYYSLTLDNLGHFIDHREIDLVKKIVNQVSVYFSIDLNSQDFIVNFTIHLKNLMKRIKHNRYTPNPMNTMVKASYPFIYEIAVFISNELFKEENLKLNENEITFIAFHVGAFFERRKLQDKRKYTAVLICPKYYDMHLQAIQFMEKHFAEDIQLIDIFTDMDAIPEQLEAQLVISTIELPLTSLARKYILIHPFPKNEDISKIRKIIMELDKHNGYLQLKQYLQRFFKPSLFHRNYYAENEITMITRLCSDLITFDYVPQDYTKAVIERELMSSTAFNNHVAIPHSIHKNAHETSISVVINDKPMKWGNYEVHIIVLLAICEEDKESFQDIFEGFIDILSEIKNVEKLLKTQNYEEFIFALSSLYES
ncbi:BglG family transcription antiterminator [Paenibacillus phocaensis]|uniref:BglG family transcription antiterminator n=1 Tax=Paenibacillus phocaensis TaxID=1776378 RepID=UPI000839CFB6|nr:PRD domain-containing protein [Paenibacillus phocaensis]